MRGANARAHATSDKPTISPPTSRNSGSGLCMVLSIGREKRSAPMSSERTAATIHAHAATRPGGGHVDAYAAV